MECQQADKLYKRTSVAERIQSENFNTQRFPIRDSQSHQNQELYVKFVCSRSGLKAPSCLKKRQKFYDAVSSRASPKFSDPDFIFSKEIDEYWTVIRRNVNHSHKCNSLAYYDSLWMWKLMKEFESVRLLLILGFMHLTWVTMYSHHVGSAGIHMMCST